MSTLGDLLDLQAVDLDIDRLLQERQDLPALAAYKKAHQAWQSLVDALESSKTSVRQTDLDLDRTSGELEIAEAKLAAEQNRLYAGGLSARDAEYLRREVDMLARKNEGMESEVLQLMEEKENATAKISGLEAEIEAASTEKSSFEAEIAESWKAIDGEIARKEERKLSIVSMVDEDLLGLYDTLRAQRDDGVAVGRLADGTCGACHLMLTPAEQLEAQRSSPPRCLHCNSIVVP